MNRLKQSRWKHIREGVEQAKVSPGDISALVALIAIVIAVILVRRDFKKNGSARRR